MTLAYLKHEWNGVLDIFEFIGRALYQVFEKTLLVVVAIQALVVGTTCLFVTMFYVWAFFPFLSAIAAIAPLALPYNFPWDEKDLGRLMIWWAVIALCVFAWSFTVP